MNIFQLVPDLGKVLNVVGGRHLKTLTICLYFRASSDGKDNGTSIAAQMKKGRKWASDLTTALASFDVAVETIEFTDNDLSASKYATYARPGYDSWMKLATQGKLHILWTISNSRADRKVAGTAELREVCVKHGMLWAYGSSVYDPRIPADYTAIMRDAVSSEELPGLISTAVRDGKLERAERGDYPGMLPFGYRREYNPANGECVGQFVDEDQSAVIRLMVDLFMQKLSLTAIARHVNNLALDDPTYRRPRDGKWSSVRVRRVIDAHAIAPQWRTLRRGRSIEDRQIFDLVISLHKQGETAKTIARAMTKDMVAYPIMAEWNTSAIRGVLRSPTNAGLLVHQGKVLGKGNWPAIITEQEHDIIMARTGGDVTPRDGERVKNLFTGIAVCGQCEKPLQSNKRAKYKDRIACPTGHTSIFMDEFDAVIEESLMVFLESSDARQLLVKQGDTSELVDAQREAEAARAKLAEIRKSYAANLVDIETLQAVLPTLKSKVATAEERARRIGVPSAIADLVSVDAREVWAQLTITQRRAAVRILMRPILCLNAKHGLPPIPVVDRILPGWLHLDREPLAAVA